MLNKITLFVAALIICCSIASAQTTFNKSGITYTVQTSSDVFVTGYTSGCPSDVKIPTFVSNGGDSYQVKEIADEAFKDCTALETIEIPSSIVRIGSRCFIGCKNLEAITFDEDDKTAKYYIENDVLYAKGESGRHLAVVPAKKIGALVVPSDVTMIWQGAFDNSSLTKVVMSTSVTIKTGTFKDCKNLKSLIFEGAVPEIQADAFSGSTGFTAYVPENQYASSQSRFSNCSTYSTTTNGLKVIITNNGECHILDTNRSLDKTISIYDDCSDGRDSYPVTEIMDCAFSSASGMLTIYIYPELVRIGSYPFEECKDLEEILVYTPGKYTSDNGVLYANSAKELCACPIAKKGELVIPNTVTFFWAKAFENTSLTKITMPTSLTAIKDKAFKNAKNLTTIEFTTSKAPTFGKKVFEGCTGTITLLVPSGSKATYEAATSHLSNVIVVEKNPTAIDIVNTDKKKEVYKTIENGRVVIIRDGEKFDLSGRKL